MPPCFSILNQTRMSSDFWNVNFFWKIFLWPLFAKFFSAKHVFQFQLTKISSAKLAIFGSSIPESFFCNKNLVAKISSIKVVNLILPDLSMLFINSKTCEVLVEGDSILQRLSSLNLFHYKKTLGAWLKCFKLNLYITISLEAYVVP